MAANIGHATVSFVRSTSLVLAGLLSVGMLVPAVGTADPADCNEPSCAPGITGGVVLGASCPDAAHFVFGTTSWGRLVFCGSPRRYEPRYFRSPPMAGVKDEDADCVGHLNQVAQAPDGLFMTCAAGDGATTWVRGDA